jgi:hypothetical protein
MSPTVSHLEIMNPSRVRTEPNAALKLRACATESVPTRAWKLQIHVSGVPCQIGNGCGLSL